MKRSAVIISLLLVTLFSNSATAMESPKPESIAEKMSFKLVRGVTNVATAIVELPKQTILTTRTHGDIGYVVGPIKGIGMTFYRGLIGITETIFFMVPQPGYYDPMIDPTYVWEDWEDPRASVTTAQTTTEQKPGE